MWVKSCDAICDMSCQLSTASCELWLWTCVKCDCANAVCPAAWTFAWEMIKLGTWDDIDIYFEVGSARVDVTLNKIVSQTVWRRAWRSISMSSKICITIELAILLRDLVDIKNHTSVARWKLAQYITTKMLTLLYSLEFVHNSKHIRKVKNVTAEISQQMYSIRTWIHYNLLF